MNVTTYEQFLNLIAAEFVIMLAGKSKTIEKFQKQLDKNGAEFPVSLSNKLKLFIVPCFCTKCKHYLFLGLPRH